jgi:hypothetical protein
LITASQDISQLKLISENSMMMMMIIIIIITGLLWLSIHYANEKVGKVSYSTRKDHVHSAEQLNTGCLFPLHPCQLSQTVRIVAGFPTKIRIGWEKAMAIFGPKSFGLHEDPDYRYPDYRDPDRRVPNYRVPDYRDPDYRDPDYRFRITGFRITGFRITECLM